MILDWWHLRQKCAELGSRICHGHLAKERFLRQVQRRLWRGEVDAACCAGWLAHPCAASRRAERAPLCSACLTKACEGRSTRCSAPPAATYDQANALPDEPGGQHGPNVANGDFSAK